MSSTSRENARLLRVVEVAKQLGLSRTKIYEMMDAGELEYCRFGRSRRVPLSAVDQLIRESTVNANSGDNGNAS